MDPGQVLDPLLFANTLASANEATSSMFRYSSLNRLLKDSTSGFSKG